jgi:hypothetical protein
VLHQQFWADPTAKNVVLNSQRYTDSLNLKCRIDCSTLTALLGSATRSATWTALLGSATRSATWTVLDCQCYFVSVTFSVLN